MQLANGRVCLIREKHVDPDGDLVLHVEYWRDAADQAEHPDTPREAHDHRFRTVHSPEHPLAGMRRAVQLHENLWEHRIGPVLNGCQREDFHRAVMKHERGQDAYGYLSHPHVAMLEVAPRE